MGMFDHFPYTNFHELNLDWILQALKEIEKTMDQFVAINSLKFADPIQWNITKQYEKNTIVIDPLTGTAYISVEPVPSGVALTNTDYWTIVFDLRSFVVRTAKNFTLRWEEATTLTATMPINEGQWVVWNDTLYRALSNIIAGDQYVIGSNIERITVEQIKNEIYQSFNNIIGSLEDLDTTDKSNLVAAINEVLQKLTDTVGDLNDLDTTDKSNVVAAINDELAYLKSIGVNVALEGADNTGNTDCSSIISALMDDYNILYFPEGTYLFSSPVDIPRDNITIIGSNAKIKVNGDTDAFRITNNSNFNIHYVDFECEVTSTHSAILLDSAYKCSVDNITVLGFNCGVSTIKSSYITVNKSTFNNVNIAVLFDGNSHSDSTNQHNTAANCICYNPKLYTAFFIRRGRFNTIHHCYIEGGHDFGASAQESAWCKIHHNTAINLRKEGFNLQDCDYSEISDNFTAWDYTDPNFGNTFGIDFGISIWGTGTYSSNQCKIYNNYIQGSYKSGIAIWGEAYGTSVMNNQCVRDSQGTGSDGDGFNAGIVIGGIDSTHIPYMTSIMGNFITPVTGRNAIITLDGYSSHTKIFGNVTTEGNIQCGDNNAEFGGNNRDVLFKIENISTNGTTGTIFYSKEGSYINLCGYMTVSGASGDVILPIPTAPTNYLEGSALSFNKIGAGEPCNCNYAADGIHISASVSTDVPDGTYYLYGRYRYIANE